MLDTRELEGIVRETFGLGPHMRGIRIVSTSGSGQPDDEVPFRGDPLVPGDQMYVRITFRDMTPGLYNHGADRVERDALPEDDREEPRLWRMWVYCPTARIEDWTIRTPDEDASRMVERLTTLVRSSMDLGHLISRNADPVRRETKREEVRRCLLDLGLTPEQARGFFK